MELQIPYKFTPRNYQLPLFDAIKRGVRRAVVVAHRRSGKDKTCLNIMIIQMLKRVGVYYYVFPTYNQGRKVLWDGIDRDGMRFLDHFPPEIIDGKPNDQQMKIRLKNGSLFQVIGSDNVDAIVGTNPVGVVFSEYALHDPKAWGFIRPILAENNGWAIFIFTPRGENHGYDIYELAKGSVEWFTQMIPVSATRVVSQGILDQERAEIHRLYGDESLYLQEYECNFSVPISGAYYAEHISTAYQEGRIGRVPHEKTYPVDTWWDLGTNDKMAIWFSQSVGHELRLIDYLEESGKGISHYIGLLKEKPYIYGDHYAPHDIEATELTTGKSRKETASNLGIRFNTVPRLPIIDGIDAVRNLFGKCWFDGEKCRDGLNALKSYRKQWDDGKKTYMNQPFHDWSSDGADAFRTLAVGLDLRRAGRPLKKEDKYLRPKYEVQFNPATV